MRLFFTGITAFCALATGLLEARAIDTEQPIIELQRRIKMGLPPSGKIQFENVQRAWREYRDEKCRYRQTSFPLIISERECITASNAMRMDELRTELQWITGIAGRTIQRE